MRPLDARASELFSSLARGPRLRLGHELGGLGDGRFEVQERPAGNRIIDLSKVGCQLPKLGRLDSGVVRYLRLHLG